MHWPKVHVGNSRVVWKVRPMPARTHRRGPCPDTTAPSSSTAPCDGAYVPARMLSSVVLPDPLGPIRPTIVSSET